MQSLFIAKPVPQRERLPAAVGVCALYIQPTAFASLLPANGVLIFDAQYVVCLSSPTTSISVCCCSGCTRDVGPLSSVSGICKAFNSSLCLLHGILPQLMNL